MANVRARVLGAILGSAITIFARSGRADGLPASWTEFKRDVGLGFVETFVTRARLQSPMPVNGENTPRHLVGLGVPVGGATFFGVGAALETRTGFLTSRLFEFRYSFASAGLGGDAVANGAKVGVELGQINVAEFGWGLGVQYAEIDGRWKLSFQLTGGLSRTWTKATILEAHGAVSTGDVLQTDGYLRADLAACARLGKTGLTMAWGCLTVEPYLYARDWWTGGSLGFRIAL